MEEIEVQPKVRKCTRCSQTLAYDKYLNRNNNTCKSCVYKSSKDRYYKIKNRYKEAAGDCWWLKQYFQYYEVLKRMN